MNRLDIIAIEFKGTYDKNESLLFLVGRNKSISFFDIKWNAFSCCLYLNEMPLCHEITY